MELVATRNLVLLCLPDGHWIGPTCPLPREAIRGRLLSLSLFIDKTTKPKLKVVIFGEQGHLIAYSTGEVAETTVYRPTETTKLTPLVVQELKLLFAYRFGWQQLPNHYRSRRTISRSRGIEDEQQRPSN